MTDIILDVKHLEKKYGRGEKGIQAVNDISFSVKKGSLFAFLGPNGAGKSTTINIIATLVAKTGGTVEVDGFDLDKEEGRIRDSIGIVFQESRLDGLLTVEENLYSRGALYKMGKKEVDQRIENIDGFLSIKELLDRPYGRLSGGQKRKADIARALIHYPKILILDEPTTGLDPKTRLQVWEAIKDIQKNQGITIFLTTHYMEEVSMADDVVIIDRGKIVARGTPTMLKTKYSSDVLKVVPHDKEKYIEYLKKRGLSYHVYADVINIPLKSSKRALEILMETEDMIETFEVIKGNMDDVFLAITGRYLENEEEDDGE